MMINTDGMYGYGTVSVSGELDAFGGSFNVEQTGYDFGDTTQGQAVFVIDPDGYPMIFTLLRLE